MESKNIIKSKTFWTNVIMAAVFPFLPESIKPNEMTLMMIFAGINIALRLISKGKVELV